MEANATIMATNLTTEDLALLAWFYDGVACRANHGRGRFTSYRRLIRAGYLQFQHTGPYDWVITITKSGMCAVNTKLNK